MGRDEKPIKGIWEWGRREVWTLECTKDRQSAMMKRTLFFSLLMDPAHPPASPSSPAALCCKAQPADWPDSCHAPSHRGSRRREPSEDRIGSHHLVENWNRDGFLWRGVDGRGVWIEVDCNLWFLADSLPSGTVVTLGESQRKKLWPRFLLCACRGMSMSDLPTQREDGWWTYYGQIFVMFQQIDSETI